MKIDKWVAIDMDDVCLGFVEGLRAAVKKEYDVVIDDEDISTWDLASVLNPIIGRSWWAWMRERSWLWANFPAIDGAIGGLDTLSRQGYYLECITSKPAWATQNVWKWIGKWRPAFNRVTIVTMDDRKVDYTDAALLLDDKPSNVQEFLNEGRMGLLFDRPHNRDNVTLTRVNNWSEAVEMIKEMVQ